MNDREMTDRADEELARTAARYVDGEMTPGDRAEFEARLRGDAAAARAVRDVEEVCGLLATERAEPGFAPSEGFARRAVEAARREAVREVRAGSAGDPAPGEVARAVALLRRLAVAAAVIGAVALLVVAGLGRGVGDQRLEAAPAEVRRVIEELGERARAMPAELRAERK